MEDGIIYTFGDIDALVVIFDGLRMLFDPAVTTFFSVTGGLGLGVASTVAAMIALIGTMNQYISQQQLQMQGPLVGLFIYALVAIPTVDRMYVSDINTGKTLPIYDVPIGLGVVGYGMSLISTAMKTLQTQLERLNLANRNTCTMVKSFIDEKTDNGKVFDLRRYICQGEANQTGDDPYNCGLEDSSLATTIADGWDTFITTVEAMAGDPDAKFMYGNVVAEAFLKTQGIAAIPDSVFPSDLSTLILGSPTVDNPTTPAHTGISVTEASMNLFGYYYVGPVDDNENATSGYVPSPIPSLDKIIETKIVNCEGANCHKLLQCNDVTVTGTSGNTHTLACGGHVETEASYADTIALYNAETTCTDKEAEPNLVEVLRCFVQGAYTKLEQGDYTNLTSLQQKIIQASPVEVIRAYSIGTDQDKGALTKIMGGHLSKYLAYSMLNNYVADLAQLTTFLLEKGNKEIAIEDSQVRQIHQEIRVKLEQASILKQKADENLAELMKSVEYVNIIERYSKSMSRQVSDHLTKRN